MKSYLVIVTSTPEKKEAMQAAQDTILTLSAMADRYAVLYLELGALHISNPDGLVSTLEQYELDTGYLDETTAKKYDMTAQENIQLVHRTALPGWIEQFDVVMRY